MDHPLRTLFCTLVLWAAGDVAAFDQAPFDVPRNRVLLTLAPGAYTVQLAGLVGACIAALGCYALAVRLGEGRAPRRERDPRDRE